MKRIHWCALAANYMFIADKKYVNLDTLEGLMIFLNDRLDKDEYDINIDSESQIREFLYNNTYFECTFDNNDEISCIYTKKDLSSILEIKKFNLGEDITELIKKYVIKTQLENMSSITLTSFKIDEYSHIFTLYINDDEYIIKKGKLVKALQPIHDTAEDILLILRYLIDLQYALYKDGNLYTYSKSKVLGFKISDNLKDIILSCKK